MTAEKQNKEATNNSITQSFQDARESLAYLEVLADSLDVDLEEEMRVIIRNLNTIKNKLKLATDPDGRKKRFQKITEVTPRESLTSKRLFEASFNTLQAALGTPLPASEHSHFVWAFTSISGDIFTIYDYSVKEGGQSLTKKKNLMNKTDYKWRIAGPKEAKTYDFVRWLNERIAEVSEVE